MTTYAIGDVQGCFHAFQSLLVAIDFDPAKDKLWLVGDMVNRGSGSLEMLRWCYAHRSSINVVLGNHDLHALVVANGVVKAKKYDTLDSLLAAGEADQLLNWLRHQPLMVKQDDFVMVHAGLLPQWSVAQALALAQEVEAALQADDYVDFLSHMYGNEPHSWCDDLSGYDRLRVITNAITRLRVCSENGEMSFEFKGELDAIPKGYMPWFDVPDRQSLDHTVVFGHWSALGLQHRNHVHALDTGCLWGGELTALALDTLQITQVPYDLKDKPILKHLK